MPMMRGYTHRFFNLGNHLPQNYSNRLSAESIIRPLPIALLFSLLSLCIKASNDGSPTWPGRYSDLFLAKFCSQLLFQPQHGFL
jgi:hypothetical protein